MKAFVAATTLAAIIALGGAEATSIEAQASTLLGDGDYKIMNVATGDVLSFYRSGVTNFAPVSAVTGTPLKLQYNGSMARLSGGDKCVSAEQSSDGHGYENAAVAHGCAVGQGLLTGIGTEEKRKQWWYIIPSGSTTTISTSPTSDEGTSSLSNREIYQENKKTSNCPHDGPWLAAHPGYANTHTECLSDLESYYKTLSRMIKRTKLAHAQITLQMMGKTIQKEVPTYFIVPAEDQHTKAISATPVNTFGGHISTALESWDKSGANRKQLWTITKA